MKKITFHNVANFFLAHWNKFRTRVFGINWRERQFEWREQQVSIKSPGCLNGECIHCGCDTPDKFWEPDECERGCYPAWMEKAPWENFEKTIEIIMNIPIALREDQFRAMEKLWHIYGNHGPKSNHNQHRFIQTILEKGTYDKRWLVQTRRMQNAAMQISPKSNFNDYLVSEECVEKVDEIINTIVK